MNFRLQASAVVVIALASMFTARGWLNPSSHEVSTQFGEPILVNNDNHTLGPIVDSAPETVYSQGLNLPVTFYSQGLNLLVPVDGSGNVGSAFEEYFTSTDCTGTPYYLLPDDTPEPDASVDVSLLVSAGGYFKTEDTSPVSLAMHSAQDPGSCDSSISTGYALPVTPVRNLPFAVPVSMPLHLAK